MGLVSLSRSLPHPASDCTATCILVFDYFLNDYMSICTDKLGNE